MRLTDPLLFMFAIVGVVFCPLKFMMPVLLFGAVGALLIWTSRKPKVSAPPEFKP